MKSLQVLAALSYLTAAPTSALEIYSSNEGNYSVSFPVAPETTQQSIGPNKIVVRSERDGDVVYVVAHGDFVEALKPDIEMNANIDNYAHEVHASVTSRKTISLQRGEKTLQAIEFSYDGTKQSGAGIVVVDGKSSYLVAAGSVKPARHPNEVATFVASFKLAPKH